MNSGDFLIGQPKCNRSFGSAILHLCDRTRLELGDGCSLLVMSRVRFKIVAIFSRTERLIGFFVLSWALIYVLNLLKYLSLNCFQFVILVY